MSQEVKAAHFWDDYFAKPDPTEWILDITSPHFSVSSLIPKVGPTIQDNNPIQSVLELGCGDSRLGEVLFAHLNPNLDLNLDPAPDNSTPTTVTSIDISSVAISSLNQRKLSNPHPLAHSHLCYLVGDVTNLIPHFPSPISNSTIDLIFDKGCFDTFQFRAKSNSTDQLQTKLLSEVLRLLKPSGFYIIITPKKRLKNLNCLDGGGFSSVARKKMSSSGGVLDSLEQEAIYVYFCRKSDENATKFDDVDDVDDDDDDEEDQKTCPVCDAAWSEPRFLDKQKNWRRKWKNHLLWCRVNREKEAKKEQEKEQEEEQEKEHTTTIIEDPTTFWKQWSENQMNCQTHNDNINNICACFEGMGSVM